MALVSALAVGIGGAIGAVFRYAVAVAIDRRTLDTFLVNVVGSFVFGVVFGVGIDGAAMLALVVGFCGAFTTFSSFAVETVQLTTEGDRAVAAAYAAGTLALAVSAVVVGIHLGSALGTAL